MEIHRLAQYSPRGTDVPVVLDLMVHDLQLIMRLCGKNLTAIKSPQPGSGDFR